MNSNFISKFFVISKTEEILIQFFLRENNIELDIFSFRIKSIALFVTIFFPEIYLGY